MTSEEAIENMRYAAQSESDAQKQATAWFAFDTAAADLETLHQSLNDMQVEIDQLHYQMEDLQW
jgi:DNA repair ATPase RecN